MGCGTSLALDPEKHSGTTRTRLNLKEQTFNRVNSKCDETPTQRIRSTSLPDQPPAEVQESHHTDIQSTTPSNHTDIQSTKPAYYNDECRLLAEQLVKEYPALKSGFDDIIDFVKALGANPCLSADGDRILSLISVENEHRHIFAEYMSYIKLAEAIFEAYGGVLRKGDLKFITECIAIETVSSGKWSNEDISFVYKLRAILCNGTDANMQLCERVCNSGILMYFVGDLKAVLEEMGDLGEVCS